MVERAAESLSALEKLSKKPFAVFLEPPSLDQRIVNQFSIFSMMSSPLDRMDEWLSEEHQELVRRIIIPAEMKWEVRDKLDQANITERVLFPGLDGLARWLKRHYTRLAEQASGCRFQGGKWLRVTRCAMSVALSPAPGASLSLCSHRWLFALRNKVHDDSESRENRPQS